MNSRLIGAALAYGCPSSDYPGSVTPVKGCSLDLSGYLGRGENGGLLPFPTCGRLLVLDSLSSTKK